jgi:MOSC domain-containing protein YiiM
LELGQNWFSCKKQAWIQAQEARMFRGNVVSLHIARDATVPMESTADVKAVVGQGLEGDRYFNGTGHWSKHPGVSREVTLIEIEAIEALEREKNIAIAPGAARRNVVTQPRSAQAHGSDLKLPAYQMIARNTSGILPHAL